MKPTLQILDVGETFFVPLEDRTLIVGSAPAADLRLQDATVAAEHARIEPDAGGSFRIVDLGSDAGTRVNGEDVAQWRLSIGDRIEIGGAVLVVGQRVARKATPDDVLADDAGLAAGTADARRAALRRRSEGSPGRGRLLTFAGLGIVAVVAALFFLSQGGNSLPLHWGDLVQARRQGRVDDARAWIERIRAEWVGTDADRAERLDAIARDVDAIDAALTAGRTRLRADAAQQSRAQQVERLQAERAAGDDTVSGIVARILMSEIDSLRLGVRQLVPEDTVTRGDPVAATGDGPGARTDASAPTEPAHVPAETTGGPDRAAQHFVTEQCAAVDALRTAGRYGEALEMLDLALSATDDATAAPLREQRIRLRAETDREMRAVVARARDLAKNGGPEDFERGIALLRQEGLRFPTDGEFGKIVAEQREFEDARAEAVRRATLAVGQPGAVSAPKLADLRDRLADARRVERSGDFGAAAQVVAAAAEQLRSSDPGYAASLDGREQDLRLLDALVGWVRNEVTAGREVVLDVTEQGQGPVALADGQLGLGDAPVAWSAVTPASLAQALDRGRATGDALLGGAVLAYRAGDREVAEQLLARAVKRDASLQPRVDGVLSRGRGESIDAAGYRLVEGAFVAVREIEARKRAKELEKTVARIAKLPRDRRDAELEQILSKGPQELDALVVALKAEAARSATRIAADPFHRHWETVAAVREQLDAARAFAKELIFDEVKYFYPYQPPAVSSEKAAEYWKVQEEVDRRVAKVREIWDGDGPQKRVPKKLFDEVELFDWHVEVLTGFAERVPDLEERVAWARTVPHDEPLDIHTFAWDVREAKQHQHALHVQAFNQAKADVMSRAEQAEVELTNAYRLMFGHRPLPVNDKLLTATRGHATEMSTLGYFSHFSPTPGRKSPFDRMKLAGYNLGVSENIANHPSAESAHYGWTHSSGHHRNLLMESHGEFAVGNDGRLWVQNFGRGDEYRTDPAWTK